MNPYVIGFIFARGGSKGVPRKNIRPFAGRPLIAYAIQSAKKSRFINRLIVSTDDAEIAEVARQYGAETPFMRPARLAMDTSPEWLAWQHAINEIQKENSRQFDVFVSIPATSPLRVPEDIDACIDELLRGDADIVITIKKSERNPFFNMVTLDESGYARVVIRNRFTVERRQDCPMVYDVATVAYAARPDYILHSKSLFEGKVRTVEIPPERAVDIDTELDFRIAEFLEKERQNNEYKTVKRQ